MRGEDRSIEVVGTGFTVLDRICVDGDFRRETLGGSCGNVLISLAMLGRRIAPVLALGDDEVGTRLVAEFGAAGADVGHVSRHRGLRSPVLVHEIDTVRGTHGFRWPEGEEGAGRFRPIGPAELDAARPLLEVATVFYADRLSDEILDAMRIARKAGAIVYFEPSHRYDDGLLGQAIGMATILKCSADHLGACLSAFPPSGIRIVTHGADGLVASDAGVEVRCPAVPATTFLDACGSGDMLSVAVIDRLLAVGRAGGGFGIRDLLPAIVAGQRLAAENCAHAGARGLFEDKGPAYVRQALLAHSGPD